MEEFYETIKEKILPIKFKRIKKNTVFKKSFYHEKYKYYSREIKKYKEEILNLNYKNSKLESINLKNSFLIENLGINKEKWINEINLLYSEIIKNQEFNFVNQPENNKEIFLNDISKINNDYLNKKSDFLNKNINELINKETNYKVNLDVKKIEMSLNFDDLLSPFKDLFLKMNNEILNLKKNKKTKIKKEKINLENINNYILLKKENLELKNNIVKINENNTIEINNIKNNYKNNLKKLFNKFVMVVYDNNRIKNKFKDIDLLDYKNFNPENLNDLEYKLYSQIKENYKIDDQEIIINEEFKENLKSENEDYNLNQINEKIDNEILKNEIKNKNKEIDYLTEIKIEIEKFLLEKENKIYNLNKNNIELNSKVKELKNIIINYNIDLKKLFENVKTSPHNNIINEIKIIQNNINSNIKIENFQIDNNINLKQNNFNINFQENETNQINLNNINIENKDLNYLLNFPFKNIIITNLFNEINTIKNDNNDKILKEKNEKNILQQEIENLKNNIELLENDILVEKNENNDLISYNNNLKQEIINLSFLNNNENKGLKYNNKIKKLILNIKKLLSKNLIKNQLNSFNIIKKLLLNFDIENTDNNLLNEKIFEIKILIENYLRDFKEIFQSSEFKKFTIYCNKEISDLKEYFIDEKMNKFKLLKKNYFNLKTELLESKNKIEIINNEKNELLEVIKNKENINNDINKKIDILKLKLNSNENKEDNTDTDLDYNSILNVLNNVKDYLLVKNNN